MTETDLVNVGNSTQDIQQYIINILYIFMARLIIVKIIFK